MLLNETRNEEEKSLNGWLRKSVRLNAELISYRKKVSRSMKELVREQQRQQGEKNRKSLRVVEADQGWQRSKPGALQKPELAVTPAF